MVGVGVSGARVSTGSVERGVDVATKVAEGARTVGEDVAEIVFADGDDWDVVQLQIATTAQTVSNRVNVI